MEYLPITKADQELIEAAASVIRQNYVPGKHHVGAAIRGKSGRIFAGVHLDSSTRELSSSRRPRSTGHRT